MLAYLQALCWILTIIKVGLSSEPILRWEEAPLITLESSLFSYEICTLFNSEKRCIEHGFRSTVEEQVLWNRIPNVCRATWARNDSKCVRNSCVSCSPSEMSRNMSDRPSAKNYWSNLPGSLSSRTGHVGDLFSLLIRNNFKKVIFLGDSMSHQMSRYLVCEFIRRNFSHTTINSTMAMFSPYSWNRIIWNHHNSSPFTHTLHHIYEYQQNDLYLDIIETDSDKYLKDIYYKVRQILWYCAAKNTSSLLESPKCNGSSMESKAVLEELKYALLYYMKDSIKGHLDEADSSSSLYIVNHGLHFPLQMFTDTIAEVVLAFASFVREKQTEQRLRTGRWVHQMVLLRETTAQHFVASHQGKYNKGHPNKCCGPLSSSVKDKDEHSLSTATATTAEEEGEALEDSVWLQASLHRLSPTWREMIGWMPAYRHTAPLYDLHVEGGDCTHYIWSPLAWEAIWWQLVVKLRKHLQDIES